MSSPITFSASCAFAVSMITGVRILARLKSRQTSNPSFDGSITSRRMRSHVSSRARLLASSPSPDTSTSYPSSRRSSCSPRAMSGSSSTMRMRAMSVSRGQHDRERASRTRGAFDLDASAMRLDDLVHRRQTDAGAFDAARARLFAAMKLREDLASFVWRDADAAILDGNEDVAISTLNPDVDGLCLRRILHRVVQQIADRD